MTTPDPTGNESDRPRDQPGSTPSPPPDWSTPDTPAVAPQLGGNATPDAPSYPEAQPPPHPGATPPPGAPPPPETAPTPRSTRLALILSLVAALLFCCCTAAAVTLILWGRTLLDDLNTPRSVGLNQPARDGDLEFLVRQIDCGIGRIGDPVVHQQAVGQFCLVELTIRNVGAQPVVFRESLQKAYDRQQRQYRADVGAGLVANADHPVFVSTLHPGTEVTSTLVYDLPPGSRIVRLELHGAQGSKGVFVHTE